jgi:cell division septation protein DedD
MKKIFVLNLLLLCSTYAQDLHEFSLHIGGGLSTLRYNPMLGEQSNGFDKQFGFGYAFFISPRFGFGTGLELAFYSAEFKLKNYGMEYEAKDLYRPDSVENFIFRSIWSNYAEEQNAIMLQIPLMLQFQTGMGYYVMAGVKAAILLSGSSSGKGDLMNSGDYEEENCEYYISDCKDKPQSGENIWGSRGFGLFKDKKTENQEKFKTALLASMEMGMKWRFEDGLSLYTSVYFDYGLNNILEKKKIEELPRMVEYNSDNPPNFATNGVLSSQWEQNKTPQAFVTKIMPMAIGVKVKLAFSQGVDYFAKEDKEERTASAEVKRLEAEKQLLELNLARSAASEKALIKRETERLSAAEKLLQEARLAYEKAQREQEAARTFSAEVARLAAEKAQLEQEVARLASDHPDTEIVETKVETETPQPLPVQKIEQDTTHSGGEWVIQVAVILQESRAESMVNSLKQKGFNAYYKKVSNPGKLTGTYYRVRIGYFSKMREAEDFAKAKLQSYNNWWLDKTENDTK